MTEPNYVYRKGEGWVASTQPDCENAIVTFACGTRVRLERRKPNPGERYSFNCGTVVWTFAQWVKWADYSEWRHRKTYPVLGDEDLETRTDMDWVTLVKL